MPEAFLSYAREDSAFVRKLADHLAQEKREIWIDWEDIPLTADWLAEAYNGIESSDNFVFIISPDSIQSGPCTLELEHALENNKRLIPILRREVMEEADRAKMHHSLSAHNWLKAVQDSEFDTIFKSLLEAMDTDLDYVRAHTRYTVRAGEWEAKRQDRSFLLQGSDLREAEAWLKQGETRQPAPTELQRTYITASRRETARRRTIRLISTLVTLVIAGLAVVAIQNAIRANQNAEAARAAEREAQFNAHQAQSLALAANAQQVLFRDNNTDLAMALALAANAIPDTAALTYTQTVLAQTVFTPGTRRLMTDFARYPNADLSFSQASNRLLAVNNGDMVLRIDFSTGDVLNSWQPESGAPIWTARLNTTGDLALVTDQDGNMYLLEFNDSGVNIRQTWQAVEGEEIVNAAFTPDSTQAFVGYANGTMRLWDLKSGKDIHDFSWTPGVIIWSVAVSTDGRWGLSGSGDGYMVMWDLQTGLEVHRFEGHTGQVRTVAFSPDGTQVLSGSYDGTVRLWDVETEEALYTFQGHTDRVRAVAFSPDGRFAFSSGFDGNLLEWDLNLGERVHSFVGHRATIYALAVDALGRLISGSEDGTIRWWDVDNGAQIRQFVGHTAPVYTAVFSPDSGLAASASDDGYIRLWDIKSGRQINEFTDPTLTGAERGVLSVAFSPDGLFLASGGRDNKVRLWNLETGKNTQTWEGHQNYVWSVVFNADGTQILSGSWDGTLILWDVASGQAIRTYTGHQGRVYGVAISPDGTKALSGSSDQTAILWNLETGEAEQVLTGHNGPVYTVAFSPDGIQALTGSLDQNMLLWDLATGAIVRRFTGHTDDVYSVRFSPDGQFALSGSLDGTTRLWDINTGAELLRFEGRTLGIWNAVFSSDQQTVLTAAVDGNLRLWQIFSVDAIYAWIQKNRYVAQLTCEQQILYRIVDTCTDESG